MNLRRERFIADQKIQRRLLAWLADEGLDVTTVQDRLGRRALDEEILAAAIADGPIIAGRPLARGPAPRTLSGA